MFLFSVLLEKFRKEEKKYRLDEAYNYDEINSMMKTPSILPCTFDQTIQAWLYRISQWGRVKIVHHDPENRRKSEVTQKQFIDKVFNDELTRVWGKWDGEELALNKMKWFRSYTGIDGKNYTEEFIIEIELKPELKKAMGK